MVNKSILLVDDDNRNIFAMAAVLKARGFKVASATAMNEAFRILDEPGSIGMVLMDMMMPGMDGYQAINFLKGEEKYKAIPVVAVTAQAMPGDREKCLRAGADDYIAKPVDVDILLSVIKRWM